MEKLETFSKEVLIDMYTKMVTIRKFEETAADLWARGSIPGFLHLYVGEEAVAAGVCANLRKDDYITSTHRGHGHYIAKGGEVKKIMAELFGKKEGYSRGRGGSMHMCVPEIGIVASSGIVGAGIPIATGVGLSIKLKKTDKVVVCIFGDGASNTGTFHEGINLAAVWKLPVVFACENNLYGISVSVEKSTAVKDIADRANAYGIPGVVVDGMDVIAVYEAMHQAIRKAREGGGPTLIEFKTYRFRGHMEGDPKRGTTYRSEEQILEWEEKCPIKNFRAKLIEKRILTKEEADKIDKACEVSISEAVNFAQEATDPQPDEVSEGVFVT